MIKVKRLIIGIVIAWIWIYGALYTNSWAPTPQDIQVKYPTINK